MQCSCVPHAVSLCSGCLLPHPGKVAARAGDHLAHVVYTSSKHRPQVWQELARDEIPSCSPQLPQHSLIALLWDGSKQALEMADDGGRTLPAAVAVAVARGVHRETCVGYRSKHLHARCVGERQLRGCQGVWPQVSQQGGESICMAVAARLWLH